MQKMGNRVRSAAIACILATASVARAQVDVPPPVQFIGPVAARFVPDKTILMTPGFGYLFLFDIPLLEILDARYSISGSNASSNGPAVSLVADWFLGSTVVGGFSSHAEIEWSCISLTTAIGLNWYPWEGIMCSLRLDMLRRSLTPSISIVP
jgi:hypothetical protein